MAENGSPCFQLEWPWDHSVSPLVLILLTVPMFSLRFTAFLGGAFIIPIFR